MNKSVYILEWFGPFTSPQEVLKWENLEIGNGKTYLYIFKGKERGKHKFSFYCGQAYSQSAGKRLTNKGHHIEEVIERPKDLSIWVAKYQSKKPKKEDVNIVERLITSVISQAIVTDQKSVLNRINKLRPQSQVYLINEWYYTNGEPIYQYRKETLPKLLPDVMICYPQEESASIYGNKKIHKLCELK